jgi:plastocyanin domain-containing protein
MLCEQLTQFDLEKVIVDVDQRIQLDESYFEMFHSANLKKGHLY